MFALIFEKGMVTLSWYAWLALRRRVSMSAIGSVIVMGIRQPFSPGFPVTRRAYGEAVLLKIRRRSAVRAVAGWLEGITRKPWTRQAVRRGGPCPGCTPGT